MPSDASIYGLIRPQQITPLRDPQEQQLRQMRLRQLMGAEQIQGMQIEDARRARETGMRLQDLYSTNPNPTPEDISRVDYRAGDAARKSALEARGKNATAIKTETEALQNSLNIHRQQLDSVNDPQAAAQWVMGGFNDPLLSPILQRYGSPQEMIQRIPQDPAKFQEWHAKNRMGLEKFIADQRAREGQAITVRGQDVSAQTARRGQDISASTARRGQDLTDERTRESASAGKIPPGYRATADGGLEAVPGGPADLKVDKDAATVKKTVDMYVAARDGLLAGLEGSETGPIAGRIPAVTTGQQVAEGGVAAMAPVLKQLFRVAGEGVFTDRDQALLIDMVPKRTDNPEARAEKMANIDAIVSAKLGQPVPKRIEKTTKTGKIGTPGRGKFLGFE